MADKNGYVFFYGTLRPAYAPPEIANTVRSLKRVGSGTVKGHLYDLGAYPGARLDSKSGRTIRGEVYRLPSDRTILRVLDEYEGYDRRRKGSSLFVRKKWPVKIGSKSLICWIYEYNRTPEELSHKKHNERKN